MLRLRVYRLEQPLTFLGLELWQLGTVGLGFLVAMRITQAVLHPAVGLVVAAGAGFGLLRLVETVRTRVVPGFFRDYVRWLSQGDIYVAGPDRVTRPLVVDPEGEARGGGARREC